ncbi:type II toxin-antitoxin system RelE/ParE family toxin [Rhodococcus rhodochrous]|uniref:type II toxin-antitoxin system RelE/ParE family toxin n=1 Tax=Rhodococcus rhodochrous TaxID=1829 RepID=UPI001D00C6E7|nr:type II toxin-antitoxin system RelE/ParE family toxin [Rhodococcus rhodochrous]
MERAAGDPGPHKAEPFRTFYVAQSGGRGLRLALFQKKTQRTPKADIDLGRRRYKVAEIHAMEK